MPCSYKLHKMLCLSGSIPATGRREGSSKTPPASSAASSATSLPFNQLIGGAVSPSLINTTTSQPLNYATTQTQAQVSLTTSQCSGNTVSSQAYPVIGDYAMIANNLRNLSWTFYCLVTVIRPVTIGRRYSQSIFLLLSFRAEVESSTSLKFCILDISTVTLFRQP